MKTLTVKSPLADYQVHIGAGLISDLNALHKPSAECLLITDDNIPSDVIRMVLNQWDVRHVITLRPGEDSKCLDVYTSIVQRMLEAGFTRSTTVVALGGGVIGDIAGLVASTYHRGVSLVNIPTSLLAMVDASVGGKVAINLNRYKNIIGHFYNPDVVLIDPNLLQTLPQRHMNNGYAEMIKIALIKDAVLFDMLKDKAHPISDLIERVLAIKIAFVEKDPFDKHERHLLNYGHTIGHALETLHQPTYLHGECIAAGMRLMAKNTLFEKDLMDVLSLYSLDEPIPYDKPTLFTLITKDKKRTGHTLKIALVDVPGQGYLKTVNMDDFHKYL